MYRQEEEAKQAAAEEEEAVAEPGEDRCDRTEYNRRCRIGDAAQLQSPNYTLTKTLV